MGKVLLDFRFRKRITRTFFCFKEFTVSYSLSQPHPPASLREEGITGGAPVCLINLFRSQFPITYFPLTFNSATTGKWSDA